MMVKNPNSQYKFIKYTKMLRWPYSPNRDEIEKITTPQEWAPAVAELSDFLRSGKELNLCPGVLLLKMQRVYVTTKDTSRPEKIKNRSQCRYRVVSDEFDTQEKYYQLDRKVIGVRLVFDTLDEVMEQLRKEWGLGYEQKIVDIWNEDRIVGTRPGFYR